jgi:acyl-CoA reductase-like NAD-dependent aldehyde dehydrogenase
VARFAARAAQLPTGDPLENPACIIGPMVDASSGLRINDLIEDALAKGAKLITGGQADGVIMPATIIDHVTPAIDL